MSLTDKQTEKPRAACIKPRPLPSGPFHVACYENLTKPFPWLLLFVTWLTAFVLQHRMNAPAFWLEGGGSISAMADAAQDGDPYRRTVLSVLGLIGTFLLFRNRKHLNVHGTIGALLLAYIGWIVLSVSWADDTGLTVKRQLAFALMFVFTAGCVARMTLDTLSIFVAVIPALNLIPGVVAEVRYDNLHPFAGDSRFGGTVHPNLQGATLSLAIIFLSWWIWRSRGRARFVLACATIVDVGFLLMTRSRTSMLALAAALIFSLALMAARTYRTKVVHRAAPLIVGIAFTGLMMLKIASASFDPGLSGMIRAERDDGDITELTGRTDLWQTCLEFARQRPLLGAGFDGFWSAHRIEIISEELHWPINQAHSAYLDLVLTLGVIGSGLYVLLLLGSLCICLSRFLHGHRCFGAWTAVLLFVAIHNSTESINILPTFPNFTFNLIVLNLALQKRRSPPAKNIMDFYVPTVE